MRAGFPLFHLGKKYLNYGVAYRVSHKQTAAFLRLFKNILPPHIREASAAERFQKNQLKSFVFLFWLIQS